MAAAVGPAGPRRGAAANTQVLQIIRQEADEFIRRIKSQLGSIISEPDITAIVQNIRTELQTINLPEEEVANNVKSITIDTDTKKIVENNTYNELIANIDNRMTSLNFNLTDPKPYNEDETNINNINLRLQNCQNLELLYLKKHKELMKTFAFTLNLFDKYKYAIRLLVYILRNIVDRAEEAPGAGPVAVPAAANPDVHIYFRDRQNEQLRFIFKENGNNANNNNKQYTIERPDNHIKIVLTENAPGEIEAAPQTPTGIKLPKAIITNMKKLLQDQATVQRIISQMQNTIANDTMSTTFEEIPQHVNTNTNTGYNSPASRENIAAYGTIPKHVNTNA